MLKERFFKIRGVVQHYAWGGTTFIPALVGISNEEQKPCAEYWMGAHASAPIMLQLNGETIGLNTLIEAYPQEVLTGAVVDKFGELPYLFKVLDVREMLSIQVHPTKEEAEKGFDRENEAGIPLHAPNRNYKDRNHKPEVMVALSEFWLLHGFKSKLAIEQTLENIPEFNIFSTLFKKEGIRSLYQLVMEMDQAAVNTILTSVVKREIRAKQNGEITKEDPGWWAAKAYEEAGIKGDIDRGIFSIYFFNIVRVQPGEAIFQKAGVPHAYLEGQNIELMANSDNVLRGGLTPKHVDVPELMKHTLFEEVIPEIMTGNAAREGELIYPCPVPDFGIGKIELVPGGTYSAVANSPEIIIVTEGGALVNNTMVLKRGEVVAILPGLEYHIQASGNAVLFKAFVPVQPIIHKLGKNETYGIAFTLIFVTKQRIMKINKNLLFAAVIMILATALYRIFPRRPAGFAPQIAVALFAGSLCVNNKKWAFLLPLLSMLISDSLYELLYINGLTDIRGFYKGQWINYLLILSTTCFGFFARANKPLSVIGAALSAPTFYFLVSNFMVWMGNGGLKRPKTFDGLILCYNDALPFYRNSLLASLVFTALFFGTYVWAKKSQLLEQA